MRPRLTDKYQKLCKIGFQQILVYGAKQILFLSISELRVRLLPLIWFKPCSKIFLLTSTVPRRCFFFGSFVLFMSCVYHAVVPCGHLLGMG